jgi:hypothetical protein
MAGLPFSGCESGRLREAPKRVSSRPSGTRATFRREPDLRIRDPSGGKRDFGRRAATGGTLGFGPLILRAGPGFGPGAAKPADPGLRLMDRQAEPRLRPRILPDAGPRLRLSGLQRREAGRKFQICRAANRQGFGPVGEPAGKPEGASASDGPRRKRRFEPPVRSAANSKPPSAGRLASQARFQQRDSGGRRQRRPPLTLAPLTFGLFVSF